MEEIKPELQKIKSIESMDMNKLRRAVHGWGHGKLEEALELYDEFGIEAFRKLEEKYWKIKKEIIELFRAIHKEEMENGPIIFAGRDPEKRIQRLTSWTQNREFAKQWAGKDDIVICMKANQEDIAFSPLDSPHKNKEKEVVVADYHLKKNKLEL